MGVDAYAVILLLFGLITLAVTETVLSQQVRAEAEK